MKKSKSLREQTDVTKGSVVIVADSKYHDGLGRAKRRGVTGTAREAHEPLQRVGDSNRRNHHAVRCWWIWRGRVLTD